MISARHHRAILAVWCARATTRAVMPWVGIVLLVLSEGAPTAAGAQQKASPSALPVAQSCTGSSDTSTVVALNCAVLVPIPELPHTSGSIRLLPVHSPFGVAVTADGRPRYHLVGTFAGLPPARSLGKFSGYVAWAYTLALDSSVKLGPVVNGRVDLGELDYVQFRILVSAERAPSTISERSGRLVLRGTSPSARLMTHRDLLQPSAPGALRDSASASRAMAGMEEARTAHRAPERGEPARWSMPPLPPRLPMMPGMRDLIPPATPFLPSANDSTLSAARPSEAAHLSNGDTLTLDARLVQRSIAGATYTMYGFNGQYPGPLIETRQGATVTVRYHNALDQPSSVHWHGVRLDNRFDGAVGITQAAVPPGGNFTYTLHFPDAGIYWYHSHVREDIQQDLGLYGNILVRPASAEYYSPVNREEILMLDDILVGDDGLVPYGAQAPTHALMGRFGNVFLVNGQSTYSLAVRRGAIVRFFVTNASSSRIFNISFGNARMKVVGSDAGKFEREEPVQSVLIAPAERYIVEVEFPRDGRVHLLNRIQALAHVAGTYSPEVDTLGEIRVAPKRITKRYERQFKMLRHNDDVAKELAPFRKYFSKQVDDSLVLTLRTRRLPNAVSNMLLGINAAVEWNDGMPMMNWVATGTQVEWILRDPATGKENMDIDWHFTQGDVARIRIFNDPASSHAMEHPIHLHGQRFLVLARDGALNTNLVWKDTAIIPAGETVDILVDMSSPGRWMLHCHIAEHLSAGMMAMFTVEPRMQRQNDGTAKAGRESRGV